MGYRLGIDTGGTFTDLVLVENDATWELFKTPSTPNDPTQAINDGLTLIAERVGLTTGEFLEKCDLIIYGTTVALNSVIQHKGAKVGLFCTRGHQDSLEIRLAHKEDGHRYDFYYPPAQMLVPRSLRVPVRERVTPEGEILIPLHEEDVIAGLEKFREAKVDSIAVCLMWSFTDPSHERRIGELVAEHCPGVYLTLSVDLLPQIREYTRVSTTAVNAFVGPVLKDSIRVIEARLRDQGYKNQIRYMQCNGGVSSGEFISRKAVYAINSGPAAGPTASLHFGKLADRKNLLTLDMGGTSTDISIVQEGQVDVVRNLEVERYVLGIPLVNVVNIGAGGGSIAGLDAQGILRVGPQSAEAIPGPACYGRGGTEATVTDALCALGYLNPEYLLGGAFKIDSQASHKVIREKVADPLDLSVERGALGIYNVVNSNMIGGIRAVSVERGYDPRDFVFVAGGGATSAHIGGLASDLKVEQILIPKVASGLCAFGEAIADVKHGYLATYITSLSELDLDHLNELFRDLEVRGRKSLSEEGFSDADVVVQRSMEMRYSDQVHECSVLVPIQDKLSGGDVDSLKRLFHNRHEELYTYSEPENEVELVNLEVTVVGLRGDSAKPLVFSSPEKQMGQIELAERQVYFEEFGDFRTVPVYDGRYVEVGQSLAGPAIIEEPTTTIVVLPEWQIELASGDYYWMTPQAG